MHQMAMNHASRCHQGPGCLLGEGMVDSSELERDFLRKTAHTFAHPALVIAFASLHLALEHPVGIGRVAQDDGQQDGCANQREG